MLLMIVKHMSTQNMDALTVPLDPAARELLNTLEAAMPPIERLSPVEARRLSDERRKQAATQAEPVAAVDDRVIRGPAGDLPLRIYWPARHRSPPVTMFFHGGGFVICDLESHDPLCRAMCNATGSIVISVDYRRAPEDPFPAALDDSFAATRWAATSAEELGGDPARIAVAGDSAGGNLAAAVALRARDEGGPPLVFQLLIYPMTNHDFSTESYRENGEGYYVTESALRWYWDQYLADPSHGAHPYASPLRADDLSGLPPAFVLTAEYDPLRDEGEAYAERLRRAGVNVTAVRYDGMFHGFFSLASTLDAGRRANREAFAAMREALTAPSTNEETA